jgi:hypothetical protein
MALQVALLVGNIAILINPDPGFTGLPNLPKLPTLPDLPLPKLRN